MANCTWCLCLRLAHAQLLAATFDNLTKPSVKTQSLPPLGRGVRRSITRFWQLFDGIFAPNHRLRPLPRRGIRSPQAVVGIANHISVRRMFEAEVLDWHQICIAHF